MLVIEFDLQEHNYLLVEEEPYFVLRTSEARHVVTRDRCPHRGGPLHLGKWNDRTKSLTCPWHGTCLTAMALRRRAVPSVRCCDTITAVFPVPPDTPVQRFQRMVLANGNVH